MKRFVNNLFSSLWSSYRGLFLRLWSTSKAAALIVCGLVPVTLCLVLANTVTGGNKTSATPASIPATAIARAINTAVPIGTAAPTIVIAPTALILPTLDTRQIATPIILAQPTNVAAIATSEIKPTQTPNAQATLAAKMTQSPTYPTPVPQARVVVSNGERLSIETEPYDSGVRIAYLGPSDEAIVIGRSQDSKWLQVQVNGLLGWVESVSVKVVTGEIKYADVTWFASQKIAPVPVATPTRLALPTAIPPAPTRAIVRTAIPLAPTRAIVPTAIPTITPAPVQPPSQQPGQRYGAICRDGTQSGATGSGACSHHGGVAQWLVRP